MKHLYLLMMGLICTGLPSMEILAKDSDSLTTFQFEDSIVVVANRYQLSLRAISNSVDVLPVNNMQGVASFSALQLADMISPNTFILEKKVMGYGVGANGSGNVYLRGMGGKPNTGILVLINGRPDFMGIFGHPLPDVYGLDGIEQVEVLKGPSSALFGSGSMGGAINLVSRSSSANAVRAVIQGGSFNTYRQNLELIGMLKSAQFSLNVTHQSTDGHIDSTGFDGWNLLGRIDYQLPKNWGISLEGRYVPFEFDDPSMPEDVARLGRYARIRRGMVDLNIDGNTGKLKNSFHLYSNLGHHRFNDGFESHDYSFGVSSYQFLSYSEQFQFSFGMDALQYGGKAQNRVFPQAPPKPDRHIINTLGGYTIGHYQPYARLTLQGGIRYQYTSLQIQKVTPTLGASFFPDYRVKIYGNYNQGFRLPTLQELYLFPASNPELESENVRGYEAGAFLYFGKRDYLKIAYFSNSIENIIQQIANPNPPPLQIFRNSAEAQQWGLETILQLEPWRDVSTTISYSFLDAGNLTAFNPEHMVKYYVKYTRRALGILLFGKYIANLYAENNFISPLNDYNLLNVALSLDYQVIAFNVQAKNLLNRTYEVLPGYPAPEIHFLTGISFRWPVKGI